MKKRPRKKNRPGDFKGGFDKKKKKKRKKKKTLQVVAWRAMFDVPLLAYGRHGDDDAV